MWWFRHWRRRAATIGALVCFALVGAGCGFHPLFGAAEGGAREHMAAVRILPLPDRVGQQMHNLLRDRLNPDGQPARPDYQLEVHVSETLEELGIRKDETATRANLAVIASFTLRDARTRQVLFQGRGRSINSYNILESQFATLFSEADARNRGLREIADEIRNRLAVYFTGIARPGS